MFLYKMVTLLKLCKYSFHDLTTPNNDTFPVHVCIFWLFWGANSCIMHILKIFIFNSIYLDFYITYYLIFSIFIAYISLLCTIVHFIDVFSYEWMGEKERENGEIERKAKKLKEKTEEAACSETAMKFSTASLCPKFLHLSMHLSLRVT